MELNQIVLEQRLKHIENKIVEYKEMKKNVERMQKELKEFRINLDKEAQK